MVSMRLGVRDGALPSFFLGVFAFGGYRRQARIRGKGWCLKVMLPYAPSHMCTHTHRHTRAYASRTTPQVNLNNVETSEQYTIKLHEMLSREFGTVFARAPERYVSLSLYVFLFVCTPNGAPQ